MQPDSKQAALCTVLTREQNPGRDGKINAWNVLQELAARTQMYATAVGGEAHSHETSITMCTAPGHARRG